MSAIAERRVDAVQAGVGPGGTAFWLTVDRLRERGDSRVEIFSKSNILVFEKSSPYKVGVGYLDQFPGVKTNSDGYDLMANLSEAVKRALLRTEIGRKIQAEGRAPVTLKDAVQLQREKGTIVRGVLGQRLIAGVEVAKIVEAKQRGAPTYFIVDTNNRTVETDLVIASIGAREGLDPELGTKELRGKTVLAESILGYGKKADEDRDRLRKARTAVIAGVNHSGALVTRFALDESDARVTLVTRGDLRVHSKSAEDAIAAGLPVTEESLADDPDGKQPWRISGARGVAGATVKAIILGQYVDRITHIRGSYQDVPGELKEADVIIQCTGLKANIIPFFRDGDRSPVEYLRRDGKLVVTPDGNPYIASSSGVYAPVEQLFHVGMGSHCEEDPVPHAINFYEGSVGERRVLAVARALERAQINRQAEKAIA